MSHTTAVVPREIMYINTFEHDLCCPDTKTTKTYIYTATTAAVRADRAHAVSVANMPSNTKYQQVVYIYKERQNEPRAKYAVLVESGLLYHAEV